MTKATYGLAKDLMTWDKTKTGARPKLKNRHKIRNQELYLFEQQERKTQESIPWVEQNLQGGMSLRESIMISHQRSDLGAMTSALCPNDTWLVQVQKLASPKLGLKLPTDHFSQTLPEAGALCTEHKIFNYDSTTCVRVLCGATHKHALSHPHTKLSHFKV